MSILSGILSGLSGRSSPLKYESMRASAYDMSFWQHRGVRSARDALPKLPPRIMKGLFRRLDRWTWYRDINGETHYLLYRGVGKKDLERLPSLSAGTPITFPFRTSFTVDIVTAFQFAMKYDGEFVSVWVPRSAIVTAPIMYGPKLVKGHDHGEMEVVTDPFTGYLQDVGGDQRTFVKEKAEGWMGRAGHPWYEMGYRAKNPLVFRRQQPTPDARTKTHRSDR